uniref:Aminotransferase class V domain-containing protein n=1 Tax=Nymphaea colorata TaxID=210225 RepID=A0A5K1HLN0_9MAGN|nr:unnamed protein product [Nymphaea colorata]
MAKLLAVGLSQIPGIVVSVEKTQTNLVYWSVSIDNFDHKAFFSYMQKHNIRIKAFDEDGNLYRFVTHYHIRNEQVEQVVAAVKAFFAELSN